MRATDIIRNVLDLLDRMDNTVDIEITPAIASPEQGEPVASRFKQINAMLAAEKPFPGSHATTQPNEIVADIDSVSSAAGGGVNGPKHPHDIRTAHSSMYPNQQEY